MEFLAFGRIRISLKWNIYFFRTAAAKTETSAVEVHYGLSERTIKKIFVLSGIVISRLVPFFCGNVLLVNVGRYVWGVHVRYINRDLQIGLRVRDWVRVRFFNSSFEASHYHNTYRPISSHELLSLPKTNMKNKGSGNVTGLKFENRSRTQSRTRSAIWRSLIFWRGSEAFRTNFHIWCCFLCIQVTFGN